MRGGGGRGEGGGAGVDMHRPSSLTKMHAPKTSGISGGDMHSEGIAAVLDVSNGSAKKNKIEKDTLMRFSCTKHDERDSKIPHQGLIEDAHSSDCMHADMCNFYDVILLHYDTVIKLHPRPRSSLTQM